MFAAKVANRTLHNPEVFESGASSQAFRINVPTLIVTGDEDNLTGRPEAEIMRRNISGSQMKVIAKAGHYSPWEQPQEAGHILRQFLDSIVW